MTETPAKEWRLDLADERLWHGSRAVKLTPKGFTVLRYLATRPNRLVTKDELLSKVWTEAFVSEGLVKDYVRDLRRTLDDDAKDPTFIETVHGRGYRFIGHISLENVPCHDGADEGESEPEGASAVTRCSATVAPKIAVLPFRNLCDERRWELIVDGLADDIVTDLTRYPDLLVIPRRSTAVYGDGEVDARRVGEDLGAAYIVSGSVQAIATDVRIRVELIDAGTDTVLWSDRLDGHVEGVFAFLDAVTERVATTLSGFHGEIHRAERVKLSRRSPASFEAYELYLLGYECETKFDLDNTIAGKAYLERAIAIDPLFSRTWTILGWICNNAVVMGLTDQLDELRARGREAVVRAFELDPRDPIAVIERGALHAREGHLVSARELFQRASELCANNADASVLLAKYTALVLGCVDDAMALLARAFALNSHAPNWYYLHKMRIAYFDRQFETVLDASERAPVDVETRLFAALAHAELEPSSNRVHARATAFLDEFPDFDPESLIDILPLAVEEHVDRYRAGLVGAGLVPAARPPRR